MRRIAILLLALAFVPAAAFAQQIPPPEKLLEPFEFRSVGPAAAGGRIVEIEVHPAQPRTLYIASASGGLWKSINDGTTWTPIFDHEGTISIGDVAIAPSNPEILWVGTGEHNNQRSAHFGDGVYKSTDGGKTWANMGLPNSNRIGRIVIDAKDPNIVLVASMGYLYKPGGDRGIYRTTDGGKTWALVQKGDNDTTGFIDIIQDPKNTRVLYAAAMDRLRRAWNIRESGPGAGIYKSTDNGKTWKRLEGGLPTGSSIGRIGLTIFPKNPRIVYANVDNRVPGKGGEIYRTDNGGDKWVKTNTAPAGGNYYYAQIRVDPENADRIYVLGVSLMVSEDSGKTFKRIDSRIHVDHHALWIDPNDTNRLLVGNDGGFYRSLDRGATWERISNLPIAQFYAIGADNAVPYHVMGGLQDNGVWWGPTRSRSNSGITNDKWISIYGGDGFYTLPDPSDPNTVYTSSQFGAVGRVDISRRQARSIRPREQGLRTNWMTPFVISPHNTNTIYWAAQKVFKSVNRGDSWQAISDDLTTNDAEKIAGNVPHCTITTIDESPAKPGVLWVGTDDGNVWVTQDGGAKWEQVNDLIDGAPKGWWVSRVTASPHDAGTAFVSFTGFREDEFKPYLFKTTDFGKTWTSIVGNLPNEQISVVRQDSINPNLLLVGTETGCHISLDGGKTWNRFMKGMPTNAVQDLIIHDREGDAILGTHGRGIYITNISPLRQLTDKILNEPAHLFQPDRALAVSMIQDQMDGFAGWDRFAAPNPANGAVIAYYLRQDAATDPKIEILDIDGKQLASLTGAKTAGINMVTWNMRASGGGRFGTVSPGKYQVKLTVGETTQVSVLTVEAWDRD